MSPLGLLRHIYRTADRWLLSRLPIAWQRRVKTALLGMGRTLFPQRYATSTVESLMRERERVPAGAVAPIPRWALEEMLSIATEVEPSLDLSRYASGASGTHVVETLRARAGGTYRQLRRQLPGGIDTLLVVPWLKPGGADLGVLHYAELLVRRHGHRVAILATEAEASPWADRVPAGVAFIQAGACLASLDEARGEPHAVLARLCVQDPPRCIHVVGSRLGWETFTRFGRALREQSRLYASLFCDDFEPSGRRVGWAMRYLPRAYVHLDAVITDNNRTPLEWVRLLGMPPDLFSVVPFPAPPRKTCPPAAQAAPGRRILWAGRLDRQKRPDMLQAIAARMPEYIFDVYGSQVVPGHGADLEALRRLPNVHMRGGFNGLSSIACSEHLAFVYTTGWDGMPNILLEAAALGLPIVAPDVGGIGDFIAPEDLVADGEDTEGYVRRIRSLHEDSGLRHDVICRQDQRLASRTPDDFSRSLLEVPGYVMLPGNGVGRRA